MQRSIILGMIVAAIVAVISSPEVQARTWTEADSGRTIEAEMMRANEKTVTLQLLNGRFAEVPLARLSEKDQQYVKRQQFPADFDRQDVDPHKALKRQVEYEFNKTPLDIALKYLAARANTNILIDYRGLVDIAFDTETPVTAAGKEPLDDVLQKILRPLKLAHAVHHDVVFVSNPEEVEILDSVRVYRVKEDPPYEALIGAIRNNEANEPYYIDGLWWWSGPMAPLSLGALVVAGEYKVHQNVAANHAEQLMPLAPPEDFSPGLSPLDKTLAQPTVGEFIEAPLTDVVDYFSDLMEVKVRIDAKPLLDDAGIRSDVPITFNARDIPFSSMLWLILQQLDLAWTPVEDGILITTPEVVDTKHMFARTYDVSDLIEQPNELELIDAIRTTINPANWRYLGGYGRLEVTARGEFTVMHDYATHRELIRLLATLRKLKDKE